LTILSFLSSVEGWCDERGDGLFFFSCTQPKKSMCAGLFLLLSPRTSDQFQHGSPFFFSPLFPHKTIDRSHALHFEQVLFCVIAFYLFLPFFPPFVVSLKGSRTFRSLPSPSSSGRDTFMTPNASDPALSRFPLSKESESKIIVSYYSPPFFSPPLPFPDRP